MNPSRPVRSSLFGSTVISSSGSTTRTPPRVQAVQNTNPSGLNGAIPTKWDPNCDSYTDLTPVQKAAFYAFPQDLIRYSRKRRDMAETAFKSANPAVAAALAAETAGTLTPAHVLAIHTALSAYVAKSYTLYEAHVAAISGASPSITNRAQINAAYDAIES